MKKYFEVFKMTLKHQMAYRFDTINSAAMSFFRIYLSFLLWRIIFETTDMVGGYTFEMMLTYYIITSLIIHLSKTDFMVWEISDDIRNGRFTKYITRPIEPLKYYITASFSRTAFTFLINVVAFGIWGLIFRKYFIIQSNPFTVLIVIVFVFISFFIMIQTNYLISILAFKLMDVGGLYFMLLSIVDFFAGALIPLTLLPLGVLKVMRFFPYYYTVFFPTSLYLGERHEEIPIALAVSLLWAITLYAINKITYVKLYKTYEGVGA